MKREKESEKKNCKKWTKKEKEKEKKKRVKKRIKLCADLFGIKLLDHIVIGDGEFKSAFL